MSVLFGGFSDRRPVWLKYLSCRFGYCLLEADLVCSYSCPSWCYTVKQTFLRWKWIPCFSGRKYNDDWYRTLWCPAIMQHGLKCKRDSEINTVSDCPPCPPSRLSYCAATPSQIKLSGDDGYLIQVLGRKVGWQGEITCSVCEDHYFLQAQVLCCHFKNPVNSYGPFSHFVFWRWITEQSR